MTESTSSERSARGEPSLAGLAPTLAFGFAAHFVVALTSVVFVPVFLRLMGAEAYGLATFYTVLQGWMLIFDLGVSPAVARQLSRHRAGVLGPGEAAGLLRAAEVTFVAGGLAAGAVFILARGWIAAHWLGRSSLPRGEIDASVALIGGLLVLRWLTGLYQSALIGMERQIPVNAVAAGAAVARAVLAAAALVWLSRSAVTFFAVQVVVTILEAAACRLLLARALPRAVGPPSWDLLRRELGFALALTAASIAAMTITQADKLALSHFMPLGAFGLFGLVAAIAGGIAMVVPPFVQAFQPRLTTLLAQGRRDAFVAVYRVSATLILILSAALAGPIAAHPDWVIRAWTGRSDLAALYPVISLYAAGGAVASFLFVPFLLQYAQGRVRLHLIGNALFACVWAPMAVWAAWRFGPIGAGWVWLGGNLLYLATWIPFTHARLLSAAERRGLDLGVWLRGGLLAVALAATRLPSWPPLNRPEAFAALAVTAGLSALLGVATSRDLRAWAGERMRRR